MSYWFPIKRHCRISEPHEAHIWSVTRMGETEWAKCYGAGTRSERMYRQIEVHR